MRNAKSMRMTSKVVCLIVVAVCCLGTAATASATLVKHYYPKTHQRCRTHYVRKSVRVRERKHHKWVKVKRAECVYVKPKPKHKTQPTPTPAPKPPTTTPAPTVHFAAQVDPSYTQSATDPLAVTFDYSAGATSTASDGATTNLAAIASLPAGILNFYSATEPGQAGMVLECSLNVGGAAVGGTCPITYPSAGSYTVETQYIPNGTTAVTATDVANVQAYSTTTSDAITQTGCAAPQAAPNNTTTYACSYTVTSNVLDQNSNAISPAVSLTFTDSAGDGTIITAPAGHTSCTVTVSETTATGTQQTGGTSPYYTSDVLSHDCAGGFQLSGNAVPSWTMVGTFAGNAGYTGSSSSTQTVTAS